VTSRRRLLALVAGAGTGGFAGCLGGESEQSEATGNEGSQGADPAGDATTGGPTEGDPEPVGIARHGTPPTICEEDPRRDPGIYAVVDPAFASDWDDHEVAPGYGPELADDDVVIGVEAGVGARAYPLSVLYYHEVVNDEFGGPLLVTFCPLCDSGMVGERRVRGVETTFHVTGLLWQAPRLQSEAAKAGESVFGVDAFSPDAEMRNNGNLVLVDDETRSYWSQILARGLCGPEAGTSLAIRASTTARWGEWRSQHPDTDVLLPPPHSGTDRTQ
jgi:hypothetical protein